MISIGTPALLFPAISLLMLAYTNRFLGLASIVRNLHERHRQDPNQRLVAQIVNLRRRIYLIQQMQLFGALSILFCVLAMIAIFFGFDGTAMMMFVVSLVLFVLSLLWSTIEIYWSVRALDILLSDLNER